MYPLDQILSGAFNNQFKSLNICYSVVDKINGKCSWVPWLVSKNKKKRWPSLICDCESEELSVQQTLQKLRNARTSSFDGGRLCRKRSQQAKACAAGMECLLNQTVEPDICQNGYSILSECCDIDELMPQNRSRAILSSDMLTNRDPSICGEKRLMCIGFWDFFMFVLRSCVNLRTYLGLIPVSG